VDDVELETELRKLRRNALTPADEADQNTAPVGAPMVSELRYLPPAAIPLFADLWAVCVDLAAPTFRAVLSQDVRQLFQLGRIDLERLAAGGAGAAFAARDKIAVGSCAAHRVCRSRTNPMRF